MDSAGSRRFLIINADDYGLAPGITAAILDLARRGAITSASAIVTMPGSAEALVAARAVDLDLGLHLNLCAGTPLSPPDAIPSLLAGGATRSPRFATAGELQWRYLSGRLDLDEVRRECRAQIERFLATGATPSHLDSHCHLHALPRLYRLTAELAGRYGIPGVRRAASNFIFRPPRLPLFSRVVGFPRYDASPYAPYQSNYFSVLTVMGPARTPRPLHALLRALPDGVTELVCHPGYVDDELLSIDTLTHAREREWLLLTRPHLGEALTREGIRLVSWRAMARQV